jgi:hypothetical protein
MPELSRHFIACPARAGGGFREVQRGRRREARVAGGFALDTVDKMKVNVPRSVERL